MKLFNTFTGAAMNKDVELRLLPKGMYTDASNVRIVTPDGSNSRSVKFPLGNTSLGSYSYSAENPVCIGSCVDNFRNLIYYAIATDSRSHILEHNIDAGTTATVLLDSRAGASNVLNFNQSMYVEMRVINDDENGRNFMVLTDGVNEPKFFDIDLMKAKASSPYTLEDVSLIKRPPLSAPTLTLGNTTSDKENNLESKFLSFAYRYKYQNGEWSALSQFSEFAFMPSGFGYNYKQGTNNSMFNNYSKVNISMNTGTYNVSDLQLIVKESGSNTAYIVDTYNKSKLNWADNDPVSVVFDNSKIYKALDSNQLSRVYDNIPIKSNTLEVIGNRVVFGNYTEGYDLLYNGSDIDFNLSLGYTSLSGTEYIPHKQVKTNRDYEIAVSYMDGKGRMTTPLVSNNNTTFIPYSVANKKNQLQVTINNTSRPPSWATNYKFFIKQSKIDYDVLAPIIFYRDGIYAWVKLEGNDIQKVREGDFIYVKSDTSEFKEQTIRTKVLEVATKSENFLEETPPDPYRVLQQAGVYMRLEVNDFSLSTSSVVSYDWNGFSFRSASNPNNIEGRVTYVEPIFFDGVGVNDLSHSNTFVSDVGQDIRFEIEIVANGTPDTFRWRSWDVTNNNNPDGWSSPIGITASGQLLSFGLSVIFSSTIGHTVGDRWFLSAKSSARENDWDRAFTSGPSTHCIILLQSKDAEDEGINAGSSITITYDDSATENIDNKKGYLNYPLSSSRYYPNLEEWFYGDNVLSQLDGLIWNDDLSNIMFRRGVLTKTDGQKMQVTGLHSDRLYMAFLSPCESPTLDVMKINNSLSITEFNSNIIFETIPPDVNTDIFYELPETYDIDILNGLHLGISANGDTDQVYNTTDAVINLQYFNSFGWYNGFESYKIADTFNQKTMVLDTKPLIPVDNYRQIQRIASLTYSDVYESTTQVNGLNQFNLAQLNYKDMDIKYGPIRKLFSKDTDLTVFQHDKTHRVLFSKSVLYNADGTGNISQSANVLGQEVAYAGEYGIGSHPESFAFFGNRIYHIDRDRGALMRLSVDGYTEISQNGMMDYFRTLSDQTLFVGGYDPYNDEYLINIRPDNANPSIPPLTLAFKEQIGFTSFYHYQPERLISANNRLYSIKNGMIWLHDSNTTRNKFYGTQRSASVSTVFNDSATDMKHFKSVNLESDVAWDVALRTNFASGSIDVTEFDLEEGEYYAYIRQNESNSDSDRLVDSAIQGIGEIASINSLTVTIDGELPRALAVGDGIYFYLEGILNPIGTVVSYDRDARTMTLSSISSGGITLSPSDFIMFAKDKRVEGEAIKGYYLQLDISSSNSLDKELFAVKVEAVKSFD